MNFKNESKRLKDEFKNLDNKNPDLYKILYEIEDYCVKNFNKSILITMIYRTQEEQDYLYRNSEKYKKRKFKSPHQFWHAADLRSWTFNEDEINLLVDYINKSYNLENYYKWTAKCHNVGAGDHFHIQFCKN